METISSAYETVGIYGATVSGLLVLAVVILGVWGNNLLNERNQLRRQVEAQGDQINQQNEAIKQKDAKIGDLEKVVTEQLNRLKQYEQFVESLKKAQAQEKARAAKEGKKLDEVLIDGNSKASSQTSTTSNSSGMNRLLISGGLMLARVLLLSTGVPPMF